MTSSMCALASTVGQTRAVERKFCFNYKRDKKRQ